jgi:CHRD domain
MARRTGVVMTIAIVGAFALVLTSVGVAGHGHGKGNSRSVEAKLTGYEETPLTLSSPARGKIKLKIRNSTSIEYRLSYSTLTPTQGHIHFGARALSGGISAWLCDSATNPAPTPPAGTVDDVPLCPAAAAGTKVTVTGTITAGDIIGPAGQGIAAGELSELIAAIKAGAAYANLHTVAFPGGEIRGQLDRKHHDDD